MLITSSIIADFLILSATFWLILYWYATRHFNHWKSKNIPFLKPLPFVGNCYDALLMRTSMGDLMKTFYNSSTDPYIGVYICDKPCLVLRDPDLIKAILIKDFDYFYDRSVGQNLRDDPYSSQMLFNLKNPQWRAVRLKVSPIFTSAKMKIFYKLIQDVGQDLVDYLKNATNSIVDVREGYARFTTDVITSTVFGVDAESLKSPSSQFRYISQRMFDWNKLWMSLSFRCFFVAPGLVKLFRMTFLDKYCVDFLAKELTNVMAHRIASGTTRNDLIDILLQMKNNDSNTDDSVKLDDDVLVAQAVQFFAAGFETTSGALTFILYELARNKQIQTKLRDEIKHVFDKTNNINYDEIKQTKYIDKVIKEGLRKYPILPFLDRKCMVDYKIPGTTDVIDKGTSVFIPLMGLQHDPTYYPDPDNFDPERFSDEEITKRHTSVYLPFGDGPRNCIGNRFANLSTKIGLIYVLKNFQVDMSDCAMGEMKMCPKCVLLTSAEEVKLKFTKLQ